MIWQKEVPSLVIPMEKGMSQMRMPSLMITIGEGLPQLMILMERDMPPLVTAMAKMVADGDENVPVSLR